jgi:hypothetical protein
MALAGGIIRVLEFYKNDDTRNLLGNLQNFRMFTDATRAGQS